MKVRHWERFLIKVDLLYVYSNYILNLLKPSGRILLTTRFNIKKFYVVFTSHLCVLYSSQGKKTAIRALYTKRLVVYNRGVVFTARYGPSPCILDNFR
jgi:hypothetical protein